MVRRWFGRGGPSHPDPPGEVPDEDWAAVVRAWPTAALLPRSLASAVRALVPEFVAAHRWEGAKAVDVDDWMRLLIASQACLPIAHLGLDLYARVSSIVVHGATLVTDGAQRVGSTGVVSDTPMRLDGHAQFRGPISLSWPAVVHDARHPRTGRNVVIHEFAHQLDMDGGFINGTPAGLDASLHGRWARVFSAEFDAIRRGEIGELRDYAATDAGEFFAVACETFFTRSMALAARHPAVYDLLRRYFDQDPAGWSVPG